VFSGFPCCCVECALDKNSQAVKSPIVHQKLSKSFELLFRRSIAFRGVDLLPVSTTKLPCCYRHRLTCEIIYRRFFKWNRYVKLDAGNRCIWFWYCNGLTSLFPKFLLPPFIISLPQPAVLLVPYIVLRIGVFESQEHAGLAELEARSTSLVNVHRVTWFESFKAGFAGLAPPRLCKGFKLNVRSHGIVVPTKPLIEGQLSISLDVFGFLVHQGSQARHHVFAILRGGAHGVALCLPLGVGTVALDLQVFDFLGKKTL